MGFRNQIQLARTRLIGQGKLNGWRMLNLGNGDAGMFNLDVTFVTRPDVVGDGYHLPVKDASIDAVFCDHMIVRVADPERFLVQARRILKPDGVFYLQVPFLLPLLTVPADYTRWTRFGFVEAARRSGLEVREMGVQLGPAFTLFYILKEWLALLLSFGVQPVSAVLRYVFSWLLAPLLLLDLIMMHLPGSEVLASLFYVLASPSQQPHCRPVHNKSATEKNAGPHSHIESTASEEV